MLNHDPRDVIAAGTDALLIAAGHASRNPHPLAAHYAERPLSAIATAAAQLKRPPRPHENARSVMVMGAGTATFTDTVGAALRTLAWHTFEGAADHRAFCAEHEVRDFKPGEIVAAQSDLALVRTRELAEHTPGTAWSASLHKNVRLDTYGARLGISRTDLVNDDVGALLANLNEAANLAALVEADLVYGQLVAPEAIYDTKPYWVMGFNDFPDESFRLIPAGWEALDANGLAASMYSLRNQRTRQGREGNYGAAYLVVSGALEFGARRLVKAADLPIQVIPSCRLSTNDYYLFARKEVQPAIATLKLRGAASPLRVEQVSDPDVDFDGVLFRFVADLGATLLTDGRGIVRHREAV